MLIRGGQPKVLRGTAPAIPGAAVARSTNDLQQYVVHEGRATVWIRIRNVDAANTLRVFFRRRDVEGIDPADYSAYVDIPPASAADGGNPAFFEGLFELFEGEAGGGIYAMGSGGSCDYEMILGLRAV